MSNEQKTNAEKYPAIWAEFTKLQSERESIHAQSAPLKSQRDALRQQADAIKDQEREIVEQINPIVLTGSDYLSIETMAKLLLQFRLSGDIAYAIRARGGMLPA